MRFLLYFFCQNNWRLVFSEQLLWFLGITFFVMSVLLSDWSPLSKTILIWNIIFECFLRQNISFNSSFVLLLFMLLYIKFFGLSLKNVFQNYFYISITFLNILGVLWLKINNRIVVQLVFYRQKTIYPLISKVLVIFWQIHWISSFSYFLLFFVWKETKKF